MLLLLLLWCCCSVAAVGPDITARDRLVKDLPNGVFAGRKLTPKVETIEKDNSDVVLCYLDILCFSKMSRPSSICICQFVLLT